MLTNSQLNALKVIKNFVDDPIRNVMCLSGSPGTGKSYLIQTEVPKLLDRCPPCLLTVSKIHFLISLANSSNSL